MYYNIVPLSACVITAAKIFDMKVNGISSSPDLKNR